MGGIQATHTVGMRCLAVINSYPSEQLNKADALDGIPAAVKVENL